MRLKVHHVNLGFAAAGVGVPAEGIADYISKHLIHAVAHSIASVVLCYCKLCKRSYVDLCSIWHLSGSSEPGE